MMLHGNIKNREHILDISKLPQVMNELLLRVNHLFKIAKNFSTGCHPPLNVRGLIVIPSQVNNGFFILLTLNDMLLFVRRYFPFSNVWFVFI